MVVQLVYYDRNTLNKQNGLYMVGNWCCCNKICYLLDNAWFIDLNQHSSNQ